MNGREFSSKILLEFRDQDLYKIHKNEKVDFYSNAMPVISFFLLVFSSALEIFYRLLKYDFLPPVVSGVNWGFFVFLIGITCLHSRWTILQFFLCPSLTILTYFYMCMVDYDQTLLSIYYQ